MPKPENKLFQTARQCTLCSSELPMTPRPIIQGSKNSPVCIIGQAPGKKAHETGIPWNDASGDRLREWLGLDQQTFYDDQQLAILPMGFCYPGKGISGDLPPLKICAPTWHPKLLSEIAPKVTILIGKYAQERYLPDRKTLTERLRNWQSYLPQYVVLPHPSPRNNIWLKKNPWFETDVLPAIRDYIRVYWPGE